MRKIYVLIILLCGGWIGVMGQTPMPYTFTQSTGTYTPLIGGTSFQNGATAVGTNANSGLINIGFTFNYLGIDYTQLNISNNGFITFGATLPAVAVNNPISVNTAYNGAIAGYGLNLVNSTVGGTAPDISYGVNGSDFIVQFTDVARTGITGDRMSFQIRLTSTTNVIKIVYNNWASTTTTTAVANFGQVGLRGANNTIFSDRTVMATGTYNSWLNSGSGGDNGATAIQTTATTGVGGPNCVRYNSTFLPPNGLTYTWTPVATGFYQSLPYSQNFETWQNLFAVKDVPGDGIIANPATGNMSARAHDETLANSLWGSNSGGAVAVPGTAQGLKCARFHCYDAASGNKGYMDFYLNFSTAGAKQLTFDMVNTNTTRTIKVYLSTDGGITFGTALATYNSVAAWTTQILNLGTSVSASTVLRFEFTSDFASASDIGLDNVNVTIPTPCITPTNQPIATTLLSSLTATGLQGTFAASVPAASKYLVVRSTNASAPTPAPANATTYALGATVGVGVTAGTVISNTSAVTFTETTLTSNTRYYYYVYAFNDACTGAPVYNTTSPLTGDAVTCSAKPTGLTSGSLASDGFTASWTAVPGGGANAITYTLIVYSDAGLGTVIQTIPGISATSQQVTGLNPNQPYWFVVKADNGCNIGNTSSANTTTLCAAQALNVAQGFNTNALPACWTQQFVVGTSNLTFPTTSSNPATSPQEGTRFVYWNSFNITSGNQTRLVSPAVITTGTTSINTKFYWYHDNSNYITAGYADEGVKLQYSLDGITWSDVQTVPRVLGSTTGWTLYDITMPAGAGNQSKVFIGFLFTSKNGNNCSMDNILIYPSPACSPPVAPVTSVATSATNATLSWGASPSAPTSGYEWEVRTSGAGGSGATGLTASGTTAAGVITTTTSSLSGSTVYTLYVRSNCGSTFSTWVSSLTFTTPPANDNCAGAITLTPSTSCVTTAGSVMGATAGTPYPGACTNQGGDDDVWYKFVALSSSTTINTSGFDGVIDVATSADGTCGTLTNVDCFDNSGTTDVANLTTVIGTTYYVRFYSYSATALTGAAANFTICVTYIPVCTASVSPAVAPATITPTFTTITFNAFGAAPVAPTGYVVVRSTVNSTPVLSTGTTYTVGVNTTVATNGYIEYAGTAPGAWTSASLAPGITYFYWIFTYTNGACAGPAYSTAANTTTFPAATLSCPAPGPLTFTIDNTLAPGATNFINFTTAINYLNSLGSGCTLSGNVVFNVAAGETFAENPPFITATGNATYSITFQKSGAGANPLVKPTGAGFTEAGIGIIGGDYITFDGIDLTPVGTALEYGYYIQNASATNGSQNITIKNCTVTMSRVNGSSIAIYQLANLSPVALSGANSGNKFYNITLKNANNGIWLYGGTGFPDIGCEIGTTDCATRNTIGDPATTGDIINNTNSTAFAIKATNQSGVKIFNNDISNISTSINNSVVDGIFIDNNSATVALGTSEIYRNNLKDITNTNTGNNTNSFVRGIRVNNNANAGTITRVYNNFIGGLQSGNTNGTLTTRRILGLSLQPAGGGGASGILCEFNTVRIAATNIAVSNAALEIGIISGPVFKIRNNILVNLTAAQSGNAKHYCWVSTSATSIGTSSVSNYNDLFVTGTNGFAGLGNTTDYPTLANWQAGITTPAGTDANSVSGNPLFVSSTDLHASAAILDGTADPAYAANTAWAATDIDCTTRAVATDIGADEFDAPPCVIPTALLGTPTSATAANLSWTASTSSPGSGYEWEIHTVASGGTGGSAVGLVDNGTTPAGVVTAATSILNGNTAYLLFVRSNCGGTFSVWAASPAFTTPKIEPANQPTGMFASGVTVTNIVPNWAAAIAGAQAPDGYLIKASNTNLATVANPVDGVDPLNQVAFTGGLAHREITPGTAVTAGTFTGTAPGTMYYYKAYSYTNSGTFINFNTVTPATMWQATRPNITTGVAFTGTAGTTGTINWTAPASYLTGTNTILVFVKSGATAINAGTPTADPAAYTANTSFASGTAYQNDAAAFCVYKGDGTTVNITGLTANTVYQVLVVAVVDEQNSALTNTYSTAAPASGVTQCSAESIPTVLQSFPTSTLPSCWSTGLVSGATNWAPDDVNLDVPNGHNDTYFLGKDYTASDALAFSQPVDMTTASTFGAQVNLWIYRSAVNKANDRVRIFINGTKTLTGAAMLLQIFPRNTIAPSVTDDGWYNYKALIPLSFNSLSTAYIIIEGTTDGTFASYSLGVDDIRVENAPLPCTTPSAQPTSLTLTPVTASSIPVSFTASASATGYLVVRTTTSSAPAAPVNGTVYVSGTSALGGIIDYAGPLSTYVSGGLLPSTQYWYWIYAYNDACIGEPFYLTASPLNGTATTIACGGGATNTMALTGYDPLVTWSTPGAWSLGHTPTACEDAVITYSFTNDDYSDALVTMDAPVTVKSLTIKGIWSGDAYDYENTLQVQTGGYNLTVLNDLTIQSNGGANDEFFDDFHRTYLLANTVAGRQSRIAVGGNTVVGLATDNQYSYFSPGDAGADPTFVLNGDLTFNSLAHNHAVPDPLGTWVFDKAGSQTIYNICYAYAVTFNKVKIGVTNTPTVTIGGSEALYTGLGGGDLIISPNSTLVIPENASFSQYGSTSSVGTLTMGTNSQLKLGGTTSSISLDGDNYPGANGSNFPANFLSYSFDPSSTVEYNSIANVDQTIYAPVNYGNLVLTNGTNVLPVTIKKITANIAGITGNVTVNPYSVFNVNNSTANRSSAGGTFTLNANSEMRLGASTGGQTGSNFPLNFATMNFDAASQATYNGDLQSIYGGVAYGALALKGNTLFNKIAPAGTLTIKGDLSKNANAAFVNNGGIVEFTGIATQSITSVGSIFEFNSFTNSNPVALNVMNDIGIAKELLLNDNSTLSLNGAATINLRSTVANTANVAPIGTATINYPGTGRFSVERFVNTGAAHGRTWQFLSVPTTTVPATTQQSINSAWQEGNASGVTGTAGLGTRLSSPKFTTVGSSTGFDEGLATAGAGIKTYLSAIDQWDNGPATTSAPIANPKGWMVFVRGDRSVSGTNAPVSPTTLRTKGALFTGTQTSTITANKYESIGNPYASAIDLTKLDTLNITHDIYVWDPTLGGGNFNFGAYRTLTAIGNHYEAVPPGGAYPAGVSNLIQSGQAFFVKARNATGSVGFKETAKVAGSLLVNRGGNGAGETELLTVKLSSLANTDNPVLLDGAAAIFGSYAPGVDSDDGLKITNNGENTGFRRNGIFLAVERRPEPVANDTLHLDFTGAKIQSYNWQIAPRNMYDPSRTAWLLDKYLNTMSSISLTDTSSFDFTVDNNAASYAAGRFKIIFKITGALPVTITSISASRNPDRSIAVHWKVENEINIDRYEIQRSANGIHFTGIITTPSNNSRNYSKDDLSPLSNDNYYRIKATSSNGQVQYSAIVKVAPVKSAGMISIYPNPVESKTINLRFTDMAEGNYQLQLTNKLGQVMYNGTASVTAASFVKNIAVGKLVTAGTYQLKVTDENGRSADMQVIIQ